MKPWLRCFKMLWNSELWLAGLHDWLTLALPVSHPAASAGREVVLQSSRASRIPQQALKLTFDLWYLPHQRIKKVVWCHLLIIWSDIFYFLKVNLLICWYHVLKDKSCTFRLFFLAVIIPSGDTGHFVVMAFLLWKPLLASMLALFAHLLFCFKTHFLRG